MREFEPPMRTTGGRVGSFVLLFVCAAGLAASSVNTSKGIRYGIQDDGWLAFGPGTLDQQRDGGRRRVVESKRWSSAITSGSSTASPEGRGPTLPVWRRILEEWEDVVSVAPHRDVSGLRSP
jgi:hypothetical protein